MNYLDFLNNIEPLRKRIKGQGSIISASLGISYDKYRNALNGRLRNSKELQEIYEGIRNHLETPIPTKLIAKTA